jgi:hypothetical protein
MRQLLRGACFAAMIAGGIWPIFALFRKAETVPTTAEQARAEHAELRCFAEGVFRSTPPRAVIRFIVPDAELDGGLIDHRLRYVVPGRYIAAGTAAVRPAATPTRGYIASWREPAAAGQVIFRGCGGVLVRQ